jgi:hypothetical protein
VDGSAKASDKVGRQLRLFTLSALSAFVAPFVFVSIIVLRKATRRVNHQARFWNKRLQHEIARWT